MSAHYPNLAAAATAACDHCGGPVKLASGARPRHQAYRQTDGWVFLCGACVPEHHAAYAAARVRPKIGGSCRVPKRYRGIDY